MNIETEEGHCLVWTTWYKGQWASISKAVRKTWGIQGLPECKCEMPVLWGCLLCKCCSVQVVCPRSFEIATAFKCWKVLPCEAVTPTQLHWLPSCLGKNHVSSSKLSVLLPRCCTLPHRALIHNIQILFVIIWCRYWKVQDWILVMGFFNFSCRYLLS